ncbi:hypothetical protein HK405_008073, partial [Cladochytrium tenue]
AGSGTFDATETLGQSTYIDLPAPPIGTSSSRGLDRRVDIQGQDKLKKTRNRDKEKQKGYDANRKVRRLELMLVECQKKDFEEGVQFQEFVARLLHTFWSHQSPELYPLQMMTFTQEAIKAAKRKVATFEGSARWRLTVPDAVKSSFKYLMETCIPSNLGVTIPVFLELLLELKKSIRGTSIMEPVTHWDNKDLIEGVRRNIPIEVAEFLGLPSPNPGQATSATRSAAPSARSSFSPPAPQQTPPPSLSSLALPESPEILNNRVTAPVSMHANSMTVGSLPFLSSLFDSHLTASAATAAAGVDEQQRTQFTVDPGFSPLQVPLLSLNAPSSSSSSSMAPTTNIRNLRAVGHGHAAVIGGPSQEGSFSLPNPPASTYFADLATDTGLDHFASVATPAASVDDRDDGEGKDGEERPSTWTS